MHALTTNTISTENLQEDSTNQGNALQVLKKPQNNQHRYTNTDVSTLCGKALTHNYKIMVFVQKKRTEIRKQ